MTSNPLVAGPVDTATAFSGAGLLDSGTQLAAAIESGSWVEGGIAAFSVALDAAATAVDPLGSLIAAGLGWLIDHLEPLKGWFNDLTGDAGEVQGFAQTWSNVATALTGNGDELVRVVGDLDELEGLAFDAYRTFQTESGKLIHGAAQWASAMSTGLTVASQIVQVVHDLVRDVISQLVSSIISWAAEAVFTLGLATPWIIGQVSTRVASWVAKIGTKLTGLLRSVKTLAGLLDKLKALLKDADEFFAARLRRGPRTSDAPGTPPHGPDPGTPDPGTPPGGGMDPSDLAALQHYTGAGYDQINQALRGQIPMTPALQDQIDAAVRALNQLPDHAGTVFRGENLQPGATWLDGYQPGAVVDRPAFTSTSTDNPFQGNVQYEITSSHGKPVGGLSYYPGENEVLFPPGTSFEVISRETRNGVIHIVMTER